MPTFFLSPSEAARFITFQQESWDLARPRNEPTPYADYFRCQRKDLTRPFLFEGKTRKAPQFVVVPYPIPRKCVATYFPEANGLVALESMAEGSRTPAYKSVVITLAAVSTDALSDG